MEFNSQLRIQSTKLWMIQRSKVGFHWCTYVPLDNLDCVCGKGGSGGVVTGTEEASHVSGFIFPTLR